MALKLKSLINLVAYSYGDQRISQVKKMPSVPKDNPDIAAEIEEKVRADAGLLDVSLSNLKMIMMQVMMS